MACVGFGPSASRTFGEKLVAVTTLFARDTPGLDIVWKMSDVAFVVESEAFDGPISDAQRIEFVVEIPLVVALATGDRRRVIDIVRREVPPIELV